MMQLSLNGLIPPPLFMMAIVEMLTLMVASSWVFYQFLQYTFVTQGCQQSQNYIFVAVMFRGGISSAPEDGEQHVLPLPTR